MSSRTMLAAAWLAQRARALPLAARQPPPADEAQVAPHAADDAVRLTRFADLGVVVAAGVFGCLILGFVAVSCYRRRRDNRAAASAEAVLKPEAALAPCPVEAPRPRTQSKLLDDMMRAAYAAHQASCAPANADPALRRKSVASGILYNGLPSDPGPQQKRRSLTVAGS